VLAFTVYLLEKDRAKSLNSISAAFLKKAGVPKNLNFLNELF